MATDIKMVSVNSSNISQVGYDDETKELHVEFSSGGLYVYSGVPREVFEGLISSSSPGSYLHRQVKDVYSARRA